jgi:protocatechuate 3,4-dioxygenase beta subunit
MHPTRRRLLAAAAALPLAAHAQTQTQTQALPMVLPRMTEGPFYPPRAWREAWADQDADLSRVQQRDGSVRTARGELLGLELQVADARGRRIDGAQVEIWQCDAQRQYRHPSVRIAEGQFDPGFQGFGAGRSDAQGALRFRTIRPVAYPGRTPHIHLLLAHPSFGTRVSQLFVAGDPGNARDGLWRSLDDEAQAALAMQLLPAPADSGLQWLVRHSVVVPG